MRNSIKLINIIFNVKCILINNNITSDNLNNNNNEYAYSYFVR